MLSSLKQGMLIAERMHTKKSSTSSDLLLVFYSGWTSKRFDYYVRFTLQTIVKIGIYLIRLHTFTRPAVQPLYNTNSRSEEVLAFFVCEWKKNSAIIYKN